MSDITNIHLNYQFYELDGMDLIYGEKYELTILYNDVLYDFLLDLKKDSTNLVVLLPSALAFNKENNADRPIYKRWTWNIPESSICCNDPSFYLSQEMKGGFYIGKKNDWYLENMTLILKKIFEKLEISNDKIIFYGSSMGGTAAIMLSTLIPDTTSIADIPILDVTRNNHWKEIEKYCFADENLDEIRKSLSYRFSVIDLINREHFIPNTILLMDFSVERDCEEQYLPFFNSLNDIKFDKKDLSMKIRIDRKQQGHLPIDEFDFKDILGKVLSINNEIAYENHVLNHKFLSSLLVYITARIDLKNFGKRNNSLEILSVSDMNSKITQPSWFRNHEGVGINITSIEGIINIKVKCIQDGDFNIYLRSVDYRDINRKRLPIYLIYEYLKINDEEIFKEDTTVTHDKPYHFRKKVYDGEIIDVKMKWRPFDSFGNLGD